MRTSPEPPDYTHWQVIMDTEAEQRAGYVCDMTTDLAGMSIRDVLVSLLIFPIAPLLLTLFFYLMPLPSVSLFH